MNPPVLARPARRNWHRILWRLFFVQVLLLIGIVAASAIYNLWAFRHYRALYPQPGKIYSVDGYGMHLNCAGAGSPTIVLEAGLGNDALIWRQVQPELEKITRVCSYDRAGYGWSAARPGARDANSIADQLHGLLSAAAVAGPVVLMGHSIAGMYLRAYLSKYPGGVVGLVLVDPSTPEQLDRLPPEIKELQRKLVSRLQWYRPLIALGIARLVGQCSDVDATATGAYTGWLKADNNCNPDFIDTYQRESDGVAPSASETMHTGPFADLPILIFSQDPASGDIPGVAEDVQQRMRQTWTSLHEGLKKLSPRTKRIVAKGSSHYVQRDRPGLVTRETTLFIREIRGELPPSNDWGSTKTE
jgi:pimeloyl-ACP methyl ester carboxylesterase